MLTAVVTLTELLEQEAIQGFVLIETSAMISRSYLAGLNRWLNYHRASNRDSHYLCFKILCFDQLV